MTANLFAVLLQDVPRYNGRYRDRNGCLVRLSDVLAALAAAYPADLAEAGKVLEGVTPGPWHSETNDADEDPPRGFKYYLRAENYGAVGYWTGHKSNHKDERWYLTEQDARFIAWCREGVPALLARIAAQEAQIKGLEAERDEAIRREETAWREANHANAKVRGWEATVVVRNLPQLAIPVTGWGPGEGEQTAIPHITPERLTDILDKLDAAETALAAMTKERDYEDGTNEVLRGENQRLENALAAMTKERDAALHFFDVAVDKSPEPLKKLGKHLASLLDEDDWPTAERFLNGAVAALAAERAKTEKLVDLLCLADEAIMQEHGCFPLDRTNERQIFLNDACMAIRKITGDDYTERKRRARAAVTEASQ